MTQALRYSHSREEDTHPYSIELHDSRIATNVGFEAVRAACGDGCSAITSVRAD